MRYEVIFSNNIFKISTYGKTLAEAHKNLSDLLHGKLADYAAKIEVKKIKVVRGSITPHSESSHRRF